MQLHEMITELCSLSGPSGFEERVFTRISEIIEPFVDEISTDPLGNLIAVKKCEKPGAKKLMLNAHIDEIGLIVTGYEKGFLRFSNIGGVDPRMLPARELRVLTDPPIFGVIDTMPPHALTDEEKEKSLDPKKLFIDVGFDEDEVKNRVPLGTAVVFADGCERFAENRICGKSLDDRACAAILIKVFERLKEAPLNLDLYLLLSTQEELGMRGAIPGAFAVNPDYAIAVDVTHAATPDSKKGETLDMCKGATIAVGPNMSRVVSDRLFEIARDKEIPFQTEVLSGCSGTDAWAIQVSREGVLTGLVSLPIKYMHTPVELMDIADADAVVRLLTEYALTLGKENDNA